MFPLPGSPPHRSWACCEANRGRAGSGCRSQGGRRGTARGTCGHNVGSRACTPRSVRDRCNSVPLRFRLEWGSRS
eukprot:6444451-Prymnesium_polylepis.1